ncbi:MAG: hypothetical protein Q8L49_15840 [Burkholderiaceae bacterium]|nr:hypothetical protein [Burkholderiaceae bacterium]
MAFFTDLYGAATEPGRPTGGGCRCQGALAQTRQQQPKDDTMKTFQLIAAAVLTLVGAAVSAQTAASAPGANTPRIDQRQANQEKRIDQGIASGQLNKRETRRLERQQTAVNKAEDKAKADGTVTAQERKRLTKAQNHASRSIARQKHDAQVAKP